jgi:hypothetical protein
LRLKIVRGKRRQQTLEQRGIIGTDPEYHHAAYVPQDGV